MRILKNKYTILEIVLYIALFTYISLLLVPIMDNLYGMVDRSVWFDLDALLLSMLTLSPVLIILLLNSLLLIPKLLFKRGREMWYIVAFFGVVLTYMFFCRVCVDNFQSLIPEQVINLEERRKLQNERIIRQREWSDLQRQHTDIHPFSPPFAPFFPESERSFSQDIQNLSNSQGADIFKLTNWFEKNMFSVFVPNYSRMLIIFFILVFNITVKLFFRTLRKDEQYQKLRNDTLSAELTYLKYQVNPHFFMNMLNNIHSLIEIDHEKAKEAILDMSRMMRHVLYDSNKEFIPLNQELLFLRNYIQLMRLRVSDDIKIEVDFPDTNPEWVNKLNKINVPPLLLISFIENSFKHGLSYHNSSPLSFSIRLADGKLFFHAENPVQSQLKKEKGGVGIHNVKKRLKLLYGENGVLKIEERKNVYRVDLIIPQKL